MIFLFTKSFDKKCWFPSLLPHSLTVEFSLTHLQSNSPSLTYSGIIPHSLTVEFFLTHSQWEFFLTHLQWISPSLTHSIILPYSIKDKFSLIHLQCNSTSLTFSGILPHSITVQWCGLQPWLHWLGRCDDLQLNAIDQGVWIEVFSELQSPPSVKTRTQNTFLSCNQGLGVSVGRNSVKYSLSYRLYYML